jgi:hypothetical protein
MRRIRSRPLEENPMFWIRHPKPLLSTRAVAVQVVARKAQDVPDNTVIVIGTPRTSPATLDTPAEQVPGPVGEPLI